MSKKEVHTGDLKMKQPDPIVMPGLDQVFQREAEVVAVDPEKLKHDYLEELKFNEEPIKIRISPSAEKFAPRVIDCWVDGKGAEIFDFQLNKWIAYGAFPVGIPVITRRKYVEVLARSKMDTITTEIIGPESERPDNRVNRNLSQRAAFSVLEDRNPRGNEWLQRLIYF